MDAGGLGDGRVLRNVAGDAVAECGGGAAVGNEAELRMRCATSGSLAIAIISASSFFTMAAGVPLGAASPMKPSTTTPSMPTSASVGTSGSSGRRVAPVVASGRSVPALNCGIAGPASANVIVACPVMTAVTRSPPPLNGMYWKCEPVFRLNSSEVSWKIADVLA